MKTAAFTTRRNPDGTLIILCDGDEVAEFSSPAEAAQWLFSDASRLELEARARRSLALRLEEEHAA